MPEPTLFGAPPLDATPIQKLALYSHYAGIVVGGAGSLVAFGRSKAKGVGAGVTAGLGLACAAGAAFAGETLYNNFIYKEALRPAAESRLFLMSGAALLAGVGINLIPGLRLEGGDWRVYGVPALATAGFALAGVSQLAAVGSGAAPALGAAGGVIAAAAGVLFLMERKALDRDAQAGVAMPVTLALAGSGLLAAAGAALSRTEAGEDKGALCLAFSETVFALFLVLALLSIAGSPKDFPKPAKPAKEPKVKPGEVPPPPGGVTPPPAPGAARPAPPRPPVAPAAPTQARPVAPTRPGGPVPPPPPAR